MHQQQNLATPIAIVVAGIIVAGAIVLTNHGGASVGTGAGAPTGIATGQTSLASLAKIIGVDKTKFLSCVATNAQNNRVDRDFKEGVDIGVRGTPASYIIHKNGRIEQLGGAVPFDNIKTILDSMQTDNTPKKGQSATTSVIISTIKADDHITGNPDAPIKIVEYSDFQCPFCKRFDPTMKQVMDAYGKNGQVAWVYRHFPLDQIHPQARPLANASECAYALGGNQAFWKFADKVMNTNTDFDLSTK